jgi:hypothetical protein
MNLSNILVTMAGYKGLATCIIFNFKRPDDTTFACDPQPFDACCYTVRKRIYVSISSPRALDLHLVTIYVYQ